MSLPPPRESVLLAVQRAIRETAGEDAANLVQLMREVAEDPSKASMLDALEDWANLREDNMVNPAPGFWPIFGLLGPRRAPWEPRERPRL